MEQEGSTKRIFSIDDDDDEKPTENWTGFSKRVKNEKQHKKPIEIGLEVITN